MGNWTKTHLPCPDTEGCGSSDGAAISADDGSIHCFACGQHFMNTANKPDPLAGYGSSRMDAVETQVATPLPAAAPPGRQRPMLLGALTAAIQLFSPRDAAAAARQRCGSDLAGFMSYRARIRRCRCRAKTVS